MPSGMPAHEHAAMAADIASFTLHLKQSTRILALLGAGLSASSGLPTFRGAGGMWRNHDAKSLASLEAFIDDPVLVWSFYNYRRHMALQAKPNRAHLALAQLAKQHSGFLTLTQNVDGLSNRAEHPASQLKRLHGSLFDIKCVSPTCDYFEHDNYQDPIVPALAIPTHGKVLEISQEDHTGEAAAASLAAAMNSSVLGQEDDISNAAVPLKKVTVEELPHCPKCKTNLLRPAVVWFGENLDEQMLVSIRQWIEQSHQIDLMLVIGTSSEVYPAAGYTQVARMKGARVATVNLEKGDIATDSDGLDSRNRDWFFQGNAGEVVPMILESVTGKV